MTPIFSPFRNPATASSTTIIPRVLEADFANGGNAPTEDGLNAQSDDGTWVWNYCTPEQFDSLRSFFAGQRGTRPFLWTPPDEMQPKQFICTQWTKAFDSGLTKTMTAKFKQVFDLG